MIIEVNKKTKSKTAQMELLISILCFLNEIHLSKTQIKVLAYFVVYGIKQSTDDLLVKSSIVKGYPQLGNIKTDLMNLKFLKRPKDLYKSYELNLTENFKDANIINLNIKIDNS